MRQRTRVERMERKLTAALKRIAAQEAELMELRGQLDRDPLTGLFRKEYALEQLRKLLQAPRRRADDEDVLVMIDLDDFKSINDGFGHLAGDDVLRQFGEALRRNTRPTDTPFRYGGEEFGIIFRAINPEYVEEKLDFIRRQFAGMKFEQFSRKVTASFGYVVIDRNLSTEENIARADAAMYAAKDGKNRVVIFHPRQQRRRA